VTDREIKSFKAFKLVVVHLSLHVSANNSKLFSYFLEVIGFLSAHAQDVISHAIMQHIMLLSKDRKPILKYCCFEILSLCRGQP
jgi:hypothetical protein